MNTGKWYVWRGGTKRGGGGGGEVWRAHWRAAEGCSEQSGAQAGPVCAQPLGSVFGSPRPALLA